MKSYEQIWRKWSNEHFWAKIVIFWAKMAKTRFFGQKAKMSLPYAYDAATLCKKPEQTYEWILRSRTNGQTEESEFIGPISTSRPAGDQKGF